MNIPSFDDFLAEKSDDIIALSEEFLVTCPKELLTHFSERQLKAIIHISSKINTASLAVYHDWLAKHVNE